MDTQAAPMVSLDQLTQADLQAKCKAQGLAIYGTKAQLIDRLNAQSISELTGSPVPEDNAAPEDVEATGLMQATASVAFATPIQDAPAPQLVSSTPVEVVAYSAQTDNGKRPMAEAEATLQAMKDAYPSLSVKLDPHSECFVFEGGIQGRVSTTIHQPPIALLHRVHGVAPLYIQAHHAAIAARGTVMGAMGDVLGRAAVYE